MIRSSALQMDDHEAFSYRYTVNRNVGCCVLIMWWNTESLTFFYRTDIKQKCSSKYLKKMIQFQGEGGRNRLGLCSQEELSMVFNIPRPRQDKKVQNIIFEKCITWLLSNNLIGRNFLVIVYLSHRIRGGQALFTQLCIMFERKLQIIACKVGFSKKDFLTWFHISSWEEMFWRTANFPGNKPDFSQLFTHFHEQKGQLSLK